MVIQLSPGAIGVKANQRQCLDFAAQYGYEAIDADNAWLSSASEGDVKQLLDDMKSKNIRWGTSGLPVEFRRGEEDFQSGIRILPARAAALQRAGVTRATTWVAPSSDTLTYLENFKIHVRRLGECAKILNDNGLRFGIEYVGPKTAWTARRYAFIHDMRGMRELIAELKQPKVGLVLDSWHWYTAGESIGDLLPLTNADVVSIDLNDAPAGVALDQQVDSKREIPLATGVIPVAAFLNTLNKLGCDAPARCEPFNQTLRVVTPEQSLQISISAMRKAFDLIQ
jgi:sugar phosphate isomerase/epimerase